MFRCLSDFRLDARTGEEKIDDNELLVCDWTYEPDRGKSIGSLLINRTDQVETVANQGSHELFGLGVAIYTHRNVDITGEPRLGASGNRETAD